MIRLGLLWVFIAGLTFYAWKDWYKSLCGLILLMAIVEHPDMPKTIFGIQGLNPWNLLLFVVIVAWAVRRQEEGLVWDMPGKAKVLLYGYMAIMLISFLRMLGDWGAMDDFAVLTGRGRESVGALWGENFVNTFKWIVPGLLLFDGCRSQQRFRSALFSVLAVYFLLAVQVIKWMPLSVVSSGSELSARSLKILINEVGYHRVNLSMMLAGASWAIFSTRSLSSGRMGRRLIPLAGMTVLLGQVLTGGRMGYVTWGVVGAMLGLIRWRKFILLMPMLAFLVLLVVPAARERMLQGFTRETVDINTNIDDTMMVEDGRPSWYTITAGRNFAWPYVLEKIRERPWIGFGREAMQRTGVSALLFQQYGELFPHPHNAYLQWLLDNGIVGLVVVIGFYYLMLKYSLSLFRDSSAAQFTAIGGATSSLIVALLVGSLGSQTFYPREGALGMWCAIGLMMRVYVQRERFRGAGCVVDDVFGRPEQV